jgi:hypothetical protein
MQAGHAGDDFGTGGRPHRSVFSLDRLTVFRVITLLLVLLINGCAPGGTYSKHGVAQYHGDGTIRDVSQSGWPFSSHGFVIELDHFDLGSAFDKQFHLANVPTIANSHVEIALAVEDEELSRQGIASVDTLRKKLAASLTIIVTDSANVATAQFSTNIGSLRWSSPVHGYTGFWLYSETGSFFTPRSGETYSLRVHYAPDVMLRGKRGRIYLYSGYGGS